ncbi:protein SOX-19-like [Agrilus planipennis]|uniref:Sex-determining region Y protein n=1 Tax=Agrilus planipennis TaxID=224129 RepID=A0A1W4XRM0_AGRPL|nr:protein SOX-19-like [Agrilus planipennis]
MLYANENRKKMAEQFPQESNKDISKRLGKSWKCLDESEKVKYFAKAKDIGVEHKKRYPTPQLHILKYNQCIIS